MADHCVIIRFDYGSTDLGPLQAVEKDVKQAVAQAAAGEYDGNEIARNGKDGLFYMYGPDADALFAAVRPVLSTATCIRNVVATLRYGPPQEGVRRVQVRVGR